MNKQGDPPNEYTTYGWINGACSCEGLKGAGPNFTRKKVVDALNEMTNDTAGGLLAGIDWTTQHTETQPPVGCSAYVKVTGSKFVPTFAPKGKVFVCFKTRSGRRHEAHLQVAIAVTRDSTGLVTEFISYVIQGIPLGCVFALVAVGSGAHLQDERRVQPRVRGAGVRGGERVLRAARAPRVATAVVVRARGPRDLPAVGAPARGAHLPASPHRVADREARLVARTARRHPAVRPDPDGAGIDVRDRRDLVGRQRARTASATTSLDGKEMAILASTLVAVVVLGVLFRFAPDRAPDAGRGREPADDRAGRRERGSGLRLLVDALESLRRPGRRAARAAVRVLGAGQLHHAAGRRDRGRRVRSPHEHPAGAGWAASCSGSRSRSRPGTCRRRASWPVRSGRRCPFVALFLLLLFWPGLRSGDQSRDPLSGVDPPPAAPAGATRSRFLTIGTADLRRRALRRGVHPGDDDVQREVGLGVHDRGRLLGDLPLDHGDHRVWRARSRCARRRSRASARSGPRSWSRCSDSPCSRPCSSPRCSRPRWAR